MSPTMRISRLNNGNWCVKQPWWAFFRKPRQLSDMLSTHLDIQYLSARRSFPVTDAVMYVPYDIYHNCV